MPDLLIRAIQMLDALCDEARTEDGAGFNKLDAPFGKSLAARPATRWTDRQQFAAWRMLKKYADQLARNGIDYSAIPRPNITALPQNDRRLEVLNEQEFAFFFNYDAALVAAVKTIPGRRFHNGREDLDDPRTFWRITCAPDTVIALTTLALNFDCDITDAALDRINVMFQSFEENDAASRRKASDFVVPNLGGELRPYQRAGVELMVANGRVLNADDMGLGKTIQSLAALESLNAFPAMIFCPFSVKINWAREAAKWLPHRTVQIVSGKKRLTAYKADIIIMNFDIASAHIPVESMSVTIAGRARTSKVMSETPLKHMPWRGLVIDETTNIKNYKAQRSIAVTAFAHTFDKKLVALFELTGTPILNRPAELITPLRILGALDRLGGWTSFWNNYVENGDPKSLAELNGRLRAQGMYIRRLKTEVLTELPEKTRMQVELEVSNLREYQAAERDLVGYLTDLEMNDAEFYHSLGGLDADERDALMKSRRQEAAQKARTGEQLKRYGVLRQLAARGKLAPFKEWLEEIMDTDQKVIIFAEHINIQRELLAMCSRWNPACFLGEDNANVRQAHVDRFQNDPNCRVIVCSERAGGMGITLTAGSQVVMFEFPWTPAMNDQCEDRAYRMGQRNAVFVWQIFGVNTIDYEMMAIIDEKRALLEAVTEGSETNAQLSVLAELNKRLLARYQGQKKPKKGKAA